MKFKVDLLGSGSATVQAGRRPSGLLVRWGRRSILVDAGSGTVGRMADAGMLPPDLGRVFFTHFHPDHIGDLPALLFALRNMGRPGPPLALHGPPGLAGVVDGLTAAFEPWLEPGDPRRWVVAEMDPGEHEVAGIEILVVPTEHSDESQGYRFDLDGVVVAVTGDTGPTDRLDDLAAGADLLGVDCTRPDSSPVEGHMTPSSCAALARRMRPKRCLLTHFDVGFEPTLDGLEDVFADYEGQLLLGEDGLRVRIKPGE